MNDRSDAPIATPAASASPAKGRRRFLGAGAAVSPVIMTLVSAPALGTECFTPSRSLSRNLSKTQKDHVGTCSPAHSASHLRTKSNFSPLVIAGTSTSLAHAKFHDIFAVSGSYNFGTGTLLTVLTANTGSGTVNPVATVIAALVNIRKGGISSKALTETALKDMWAKGATGSYIPFAGATAWGLIEVQKYLVENNIVKPG